MSVTPIRPAFTLSASEIPAALGVDPYRSPLTCAAELLALIPHREETEAMRWGKVLEAVVRNSLLEDGYDFLPAPADGFVDPERRWLIGHPDALNAEFKTHNSYAANGARDRDQLQCQVYMHLTGASEWLLATLVNGQRREVETVERDDYVIDLALAGAAEFLALVKRGKLPASDGSDDAHATIRRLHPEAAQGKVIRADRETWELVKELRARRQQRETVKRQDAELQQRLEAYMGDAEHLISPHDEEVAHYSNVQSRRVDTTAFKAAHPAIADEFTKVTTTRRFTLL